MSTPKVTGIVLLIGNSVMNRNTAAQFLNSGLPIKRVIICEKNNGGTKAFLKRSAKKYGYWRVFGQILERLWYKFTQQKNDNAFLQQLVNEKAIEDTINANSSKIHRTDNYESPETLGVIKADAPDLIVIHTPYWVGKRVRAIPPLGVMGGHPGITPDYRGIHSPFWALYNNEPQKVGYTVFWVDAGVDTGDIIFQGKIEPSQGDSYITLSWKGMVEICRHQIEIAKTLSTGMEVARRKIEHVDESTNYPHPTIWQYMGYRKKQKMVK